MAVTRWSLSQARTLVCSLMVILCQQAVTGMSGWGGCFEGRDVNTSIRENSLFGEVVAEFVTDAMEGVHWYLHGKDADWFFLDGRNIRLNASPEKVLDRETEGPVLTAQLLCSEDDTVQSVYKIIVEILNENDNWPVFADDTNQSVVLSELTPVNTVAFTVRAVDADNDKIIYSIDQSSPDAEYFRIDLPNSGEVILSKHLDYETRTQLFVTIHASEMSTAEKFNTSVDIEIGVQDGDDQYPQFLPCVLLFQDETSRVCTSPEYTVNITEGEEGFVLDFSPGHIHAVDGDRGLNSPVNYAILSGNDDGRFLMDRETGEVRLTRAVRDKSQTPMLHLQVMAYQDDDPRKYSVATALVNVLAVNQFRPQFDTAEYQGFVSAGKSPAALVNTYGSKALMLKVQDQDFNHGFNPMIYFTLSPTSNHSGVYQVTKEGLLVARTDKLKPDQRHFLEVKAVDQESGDTTYATVVVEVLPEGQTIPASPLAEGRLIGCTLGKAFFLSMVFMGALGSVLCLVMWVRRKHKGHRDPLERGCVAQGKHPNVSLRWFQLVSHRSAMPQMEENPFSNEHYGTCNPSFSFTDKTGIYTHPDVPLCQESIPAKTVSAPDSGSIWTKPVGSQETVDEKGFTPTESNTSSHSFHPEPTSPAQEASPTREDLISATPSPDTTLEDTENLRNPNSNPNDPGAPTSPPLPPLDSLTNTADETVDPTTHSYQSSPASLPDSHTRIASAKIDKPFAKPRVNTPPHHPYSPLMSSPLPKKASTPPPTPERTPLKATLIHIDTSPSETPPVTPPVTPPQTSITEEDQPCTSLDLPEQSELQDTQAGSGAAVEEDDGFLGDEDADKISEDELDSDEEELLRVMARCNPVFITFSK